jgi:hypothetical protein
MGYFLLAKLLYRDKREEIGKVERLAKAEIAAKKCLNIRKNLPYYALNKQNLVIINDLLNLILS